MLEIMAAGTVCITVSEILDERGISTKDFAEMTGLTYATALSIRRGNIARIELDTIYKICKALDVEPQDILKMRES
jgi:DNA-binding Xre family transcriptional regulator